MKIWIVLIFAWHFIDSVQAVDCYSCNVDFRKGNFNSNDSCLFPARHFRPMTTCSQEFCKGIITRVNGAFAEFQRTCETNCSAACKEKGFGIGISECTFCCNSKDKRSAECGYQGYKSGANLNHQFYGWFIVHVPLLFYEYFYVNKIFKFLP